MGMTPENFTFAKRNLKKSIEFYQRRLMHSLTMKEEIILQNGNVKTEAGLSEIEKDIEKYLIILSDLSTVIKAIANGKDVVKIYGNKEKKGINIYVETLDCLKRANLDVDSDGGDSIFLFPIKDLDDIEVSNADGGLDEIEMAMLLL